MRAAVFESIQTRHSDIQNDGKIETIRERDGFHSRPCRDDVDGERLQRSFHRKQLVYSVIDQKDAGGVFRHTSEKPA
jgi:hypothetical protein